MTEEDISYEKALELLDARMRSIEEDDLTLEQVIAAVAEGRRYLKICEAKLEAARHKIEVRPEAIRPPGGVGGAQAAPSTADRGELPPPSAEPPPTDDRLL